MARKGYNSDWQWKRWSAEIKACAEAIKAGNLEKAEKHMERAEEIDGQMSLYGELEFPTPRPGQNPA